MAHTGPTMWDSAEPLAISPKQKAALEQLVRSPKTPQKVVFRAMIVLGAGEGTSNNQLAQQLSTSRPTVIKWRDRFAEVGVEGLLHDAPRPGRRKRISAAKEAAIVEATLHAKPADATHWSVRTMAQAQGVSRATVHRIWRAYGLQPHRVETFKLSADPEFVAKVRDIVGLYLNPPQKALVFSVDEKSQIQALDRTQPVLPIRPGIPERQTHDYERQGTTTLFAALDVLTGKVIGSCQPRHRHGEFIAFLGRIEANTPKRRQIHLVLDNYGTHTHPKVKDWFTAHPRYHLHFTPTGASWINMVERWFAEITRKRIRRGTFRSVQELIRAIQDYIRENNNGSRPFIWTATASAIINKVRRRKQALETGH
jgi:transposase